MQCEGNIMVVGRVKWFDCRKGFGFIIDGLGRDIFVHYKVIAGEGFRRLTDGEKVRYAAAPSPMGLRAVRVEKIESDRSPELSGGD